MITGGFGGDQIHLGSGVDKVYTGDIFQSVFMAMNDVTGFDTAADELVFNDDNTYQADGAVKVLGVTVGAFDDGILKFGTNIAGNAADDTIVGYQHQGEWYVAEFGDGLIINNIVHLPGVDLAGTNLADYVNFA